MKKEIINLINSENGTFRINNVSKLSRLTKAFGEECDCLRLEFDNINGVDFGKFYMIEARDYEGIINEIKNYTELFFNNMSKTLVSNISAGYVNALQER